MADERTYKIKTSEGIQELTEDQMIALAQKAKEVLPKLQSDLDKLRREHDLNKSESEAAFSFIRDFKSVLDGDENAKEAASRLGEIVGWDEDDIGEILNAGKGGDREEEEEEPAPRRANRKRNLEESLDEEEEPRQVNRTPRKLSIADLDPDLQRDIQTLRQKRIGETREYMFSQIKGALANDSEIGKLMKNEKLAQVVNKLGTETLRRRVGLDGQEFGPRVLQEVLEEVKDFVKAAGIQSPEDKPKSLAALGLGPAAESISDILHREQPPQRAKVTDGDDKYRKSLFERMAHHITRKGGLEDATPDTAEELEEEELERF